MEQPSFRVIARMPGRDPVTCQRVGQALQRAYNLDPSTVLQHLPEGGVVVCQVSTFEEARVYAHRVRELGADSLVQDPAGKIVEQTGAPAAQPGMDGRTMMGGFDAPSAPPVMGSVPSLTDEASAPPPAPPSPPPAATPQPAGAPGGAGDGFSLDALDADSLVLLDGSEEQQDLADAGDFAPPSGVDDFGPPREDGALELGEGYQVPQEPEPQPADAALIDVDVSADSAPADDDDLSWEPVVGAGAPTTADAGASAVGAHSAVGPGADAAAAASAGAAAPAAARRATKKGGSAARPPAEGLAALRGASLGEIPRELARLFPRLRVVVGFILALGLGAIGPTCYASSVKQDRIQPLLVDLSTAKAHGALLQSLPNYRTTAEIQEQIDRVQTRSGIYALLIWLVLGGLVGGGWFWFVRAE